ncbi:uncharacterized protein METZ01_LOCUS368921, partial [marine metagenome]
TPHRLKVLLWFLRRPKLHPQLLREIKAFLKRDSHPTLSSCPQAEQWCKECHIDIEEAFSEILPDYDYIDVTERFPAIFEQAQKLVERQSFNWGGQGNISLNFNIAQAIDAESMLETGVAYGWSTLSLLLSIDEREKGKLVSVDMPFLGMNNEEDIGCVVPERLRPPWTLLPYADYDGIPKAIKKLDQLDYCHYDSDKTYEGKQWAFPKIWKALRSGGILASDDVSDNLAFKHFSDDVKVKPTVIKTFDTKVVKHVGVLVKP